MCAADKNWSKHITFKHACTLSSGDESAAFAGRCKMPSRKWAPRVRMSEPVTSITLSPVEPPADEDFSFASFARKNFQSDISVHFSRKEIRNPILKATPPSEKNVRPSAELYRIPHRVMQPSLITNWHGVCSVRLLALSAGYPPFLSSMRCVYSNIVSM